MFYKKLLFVAVLAIASLIGCAANEKNTDSGSKKSERDVLVEQWRRYTHELVCTDSQFSKSVQELLPDGVTRIQPSMLDAVAVIPSGKKEQVSLHKFIIGKTDFYEVKENLGLSRGFKNGVSGEYILSYDGSDQSFVVFVLGKNGILEKIYAYRNLYVR